MEYSEYQLMEDELKILQEELGKVADQLYFTQLALIVSLFVSAALLIVMWGLIR